ncbi:MAG TPA: amino acid permease [Steroidobacteraceae bacterium]|jgi:APA family basic amino acid/polyamine antiporter|nr:amino acid permease [Steroidobacteraceae bacterium]
MSKPGIFATIPIAELSKEAQGEGGVTLVRSLGPGALIAIGIGGIIGTGIFVLTGLAAAQHAGPAIPISFIIAAFGCLFAGLCYAEFSSMVPVSGSAYAYSYATLGEFTAWFVGWNLVLEYMLAAATVAVGWSRYFVKLLEELHLAAVPEALSKAPVDWSHGFVASGGVLNVPAILIAALATTICYIGIRQSATVNGIVVAIKVTIVVLVIAFGAFYVSTSYWHPYVPPNTGTFGEFGISGILRASGIIFFAYIGFDAVSTAAQEARNPQRDLPIGILGSLFICTLLYILMSAVLTGLVPYPQLNDAAPVAVALQAHPELNWLTIWVIVGALAGLTSVILVMILAQARIFLTMAQHGLIPPAFAKVHPKFRTPYVATAITGAFAMLAAGLLPINVLSEMVSIGTLIAFIVVCIGVLVLRYTRPELPRPFRVKGVWAVSLLGVGFCGVMAATLEKATWMRLIWWTVIGVIIYFGYSYRRSKLRNGEVATNGEPARAES